VLNVGTDFKTGVTATIQENRLAIVYRLPEELESWVVNAVTMAQGMGINPFPSDVEFGKLPTGYYAEIL